MRDITLSVICELNLVLGMLQHAQLQCEMLFLKPALTYIGTVLEAEVIVGIRQRIKMTGSLKLQVMLVD